MALRWQGGLTAGKSLFSVAHRASLKDYLVQQRMTSSKRFVGLFQEQRKRLLSYLIVLKSWVQAHALSKDMALQNVPQFLPFRVPIFHQKGWDNFCLMLNSERSIQKTRNLCRQGQKENSAYVVQM